jgi:hypothetical protein
VPSGDTKKFHCPRCRESLRAGRANLRAIASDADDSATGSDRAAPPFYDGWELEEQLRHIERLLSGAKHHSGRHHDASRQPSARVDPPHAGPVGWHPSAAKKRSNVPTTGSVASQSALALFTSLALLAGTMAFVCGGILLGWSLFTGREELWTVGLPIALGGQIFLVVGLLLQLDRIWHDSRQASAKLENLGEQFRRLQSIGSTLRSDPASPGGAFYSHAASGASPELLLSDLKSQLDLLARKIGKQE